MDRKITKKYAFGTYAQDIMGVNMWVSKREFDRMQKIIEHHYRCNDMIIDPANKISKRTEIRYDGETYRETVTIYTCGTSDMEFIIREAKDGYFFKTRK